MFHIIHFKNKGHMTRGEEVEKKRSIKKLCSDWVRIWYMVYAPLTQPANTCRARPAMLRPRPAADIGSMTEVLSGKKKG